MHGTKWGKYARGGAAALLLLAAVVDCGARHPGSFPIATPAADVETRLFLLGDAGDPARNGEPVLHALTTDLKSAETPAVVLFLGDNVYPAGVPLATHPFRAEAERILQAQVQAAVDGGALEIVLVPGNHDWNFAGVDGLVRILEQERLVEEMDARVRFLPDRGCPGPATIDIGTQARVIVIDTEWWLREEGKPVGNPAECSASTETAIRDSIASALRTAGGRQVIVAGHHPMRTGGTHGGYFSFRQHVFPLTDFKAWLWVPLPIIGSAYPISRMLGISNQDVSGSRYRDMREALAAAFAENPPLAFAAGHEHSLQLVKGDGTRYQIVSGSAIYGHTSPVGWTDETLFAARQSGYVRLDIQRDGRIRASFVTVNADGHGSEAFSVYLE